MKPKRILIFSLVYHPRFIGGAEVAVKEITDRISPGEAEFDMMTIRTDKLRRERIGNVNVHRVGIPWYGSPTSKIFFILKYIYMPWALFAALRLHSRNRYDAIWSIMANYAGGPALFFKILHKDVRFILTLQEGDPFAHIRRRVGILQPLFKRLFRSADHVQAISTYLADWSRSMGASYPVDVVPNGVNFSKFSERLGPERRRVFRKELGFRDEDVVLVTASRLVMKNAVDDIISSLVNLDPSYKLLILGGGADEAALKAQAATMKLERRIVFKGFVSHDHLPEYLHAADIFVRPSRSEGLGNSFLEAMAAGIPVIATRVGGIPDFLTDGETGLFCEIDNPRSIAQKAEKLAKDAESRDYIVRNASRMVKERYEWSGIAEKMKHILIGGL